MRFNSLILEDRGYHWNWRTGQLLGAIVMLTSVLASATPPPAGVAPVLAPSGGFAIDGDLGANAPAPGAGDWLPGPGGTGASVLDAGGAPLNPTTTFHFADPFNTSGDNTFVGGLKWTDDPNTWHWTTGAANSKTDINNVLLHLAWDTNGHTWLVVAADRLSTSGDSYIDFEFLQNPLLANSDGSFTSAGPNGGRTTNDVLLSLAFTSGGSVADFFAWRWQANGSGGFTYADATAALPAGRVFVAANSNSVSVPYGAFGQTNYAANAFAEAAVDLTALLGNFDQCLSIGVSTILVKTKTSQASSASISDFINPIQYKLKLGPGAYAGPAQTLCSGGATTAFPLQGQATPGLLPIAATTWSVVSGAATLDDTNSLATTAYVSSPSATLRLTVVQANGCTETSDVVLTVAPLPVCSVSGPSVVCPRGTVQFLGPAGMNRYAWSVTGPALLSGPTNAQAVTVNAAAVCGTNFTMMLTVVSNGCLNSCTLDVLVTDTQTPNVTAPPDVALECPANTATNLTGVATVQDDCGNTVLSYTDATTNLCGGTKVIARTWTATNLCGNSASAVQTITVRDTRPPAVAPPPNRVLDCPADLSTNNTGMATAQDGCSSVLISYSDTVSNSCGGAEVVSRLWTATDACGNSASALQTLTVRDTTPPSISAPANVALECPADTSTNNTGMATAQDGCSSVLISYSDTVSNTCGGAEVISRLWTATDACGNSASALQTITVRDTTPPTVTAPVDLVLECPADTSTNNTGIATAQDGCSSVVISYSDTVSNSCGGAKVISRLWTATDACGNSAQALQTITVRDTTPPSVTAPVDLALECPANTSTNNTGVATAQDGCSSLAITYSDTVSNSCGGAKVISRLWTATDACGNSAQALQTITVRDTTPPSVTAPADLVLECPANTSTNNTGVATAQDGCSSLAITYSDTVSNTCGGAKVISRLWTATDACDNSAQALQTITVRDTTPPTITAPLDLVLECPADTSTNNTGVATAQDGCSSLSMTYSDTVSNTCGGAKVISRLWTATDACGNSASALQTITVRDTTPPSITAPVNLVLECPADTSTNNTGVATAQDGCSSLLISYSDTVSNTCGGAEVISRLWTATDACGNSASALQTITVRDTTPPTVTAPVDLVLECPADTSTNNTGIATAQDGCSSVVISYSDSVSNSCGGAKVLSRLWTATDACGNSAHALQTITVRDTTPPSITAPVDLVLECPANTTTNNTGVATAQDGCSSLILTYSDTVSNSCGGAKVISRLWTATDACGNSAQALQTITVRDTTPPTVTAPTDLVLECPANTSTNNTGMATAQDGCSSLMITYSDTVSNSCGGAKVISRLWTATDACGNSAQALQTITVRDTLPPTITAPGDLVLECPANTSTNNTGMATAQDGCSSVVIGYSDSVSNSCGGAEVISRLWTATDSCGNSAHALQIITVGDTTPPSITAPADLVLECPANTSTNNTGVATAQDGCSSLTLSYSDTVSNSCGGAKVISRLWTATDACGNSAQALQTITVRDTTPPAVTAPLDLVLECPADTSTNNTGMATARDGCSSLVISYSDSVSNNCGGAKVISRLWTATDACGNSAQALQTITVRDTTPPTVIAPTDLVLECPANTSTNNTGMATAQDGCSSLMITYSDTVSNSCGGAKVISRLWTATDACGNSAQALQTITVRDTLPPTITAPSDLVLECPANTSTNNTGMATAQDGCSSVVIGYSDSVSNSCGGAEVISRLWTATDACGNSAHALQTITVRDTTPPSITAPANLVLECPANTSTNNTGVATAHDGCSSIVISYSDSVSNSCGGAKVISRLWTATDACGNGASALQTITVRDTTPPSITAPPSLVLECPANTTTNNTGMATAQDGCSSVSISYGDTITNSCGGTKVISRLWTATDACGNSAQALQTITVRDTTPPTVTAPADLVLECPANTSTNNTGVASAQDGCSSSHISYSDTVTNTCGGTRVISRLWTATDACGNSASALQTIVVQDTTPPSLRLPANVVLQCPGDTRTNVTGVATAVDGCGSVSLGYSDIVSNGCGLTRTVFRLWTAVDQCGHATNGLQTITVVDTNAPALTCPSITVQCAGDVPPAYTNLAALLAAGGTASDGCSPTLSLSLLNDSGLTGTCPGRETRVYQVTDACGNSAQVTQTITVQDTIPPVLACPSNATVECSLGLDPAITGRPTATDNCATNVALTYTDVPVLSQYDIKFYVADSDTNTGPYAPTFPALGPGSLPCPAGARSTGRALDPLRHAVAYSPNGQLDALTSIGNVPLCLGQIVPFEVVIQASGGPGPEHGTIDFTAAWSTYTTSNNRFGYDTNYLVYCAFVDAADPGSIDPNTNARVVSYSSAVVNPGTISEQIQGTFRVTGVDSGDRVVVEIWMVLDSAIPDHTGGTVSATLVSAQTVAPQPVPITVGVQTDSLGNLSKITSLPPPQAQPPLGPLPPQPPVLPGLTVAVLNRTWTATDDCGNHNSCVQQITVRDTTPPLLQLPPDVVLECPASTATNNTGVATAIDTCGSAVVSYSDIVSNACGGTKVIARTWTAIDQSGNATNAVQTITVRDSTPPSLTLPPNQTLTAPADTSTNNTGTATAQDGCGAVVLTYSDVVSNGPTGTQSIARTWTAMDQCGNSTNGVQWITVGTPLLAPTIAGSPACQTVACGSSTTLTVSAGGSGPFTYQWRLNGTNLAGATGSALTLNLAQSTNAGLYSVVLANAAGSATSSVAVVDIAPVLSLQRSGASLTLSWPSPFILQSAPSVSGPYTDVSGAVSPCLQNTAGTAQKFFRLRSPPFSLASTKLAGGKLGLSTPGVPGYNLVIQASTNLLNWVNLSTNPSPCMFVDDNAAQYPQRFYRAVLAQTLGAAPRAIAPAIATQPLCQSIESGTSTVLTVGATGTGPLTYQWRLNGTNITGATNSALALNHPGLSAAGLYSVTVTGAGGSLTSAVAVVNVTPQLNCQTSGNSLTLTWPSPFILQWATSPAGPFTDVPGATSPYQYNGSMGPQRYFQLRAPPFALSSARQPGGGFGVSSPGVPGYNLVLQASTDLVHWSNVATNISPLHFTDTATAQPSRKFYRAMLAQ